MANAKDIEELQKLAKETVAELEAMTKTNLELQKQAQQIAAIADGQHRMLEAYQHAVELAKTGEIDASQIDEEVERIGRLGLEVYKEASLAPGAQDHSFGEMVENNASNDVENSKVARTLDGRPLTAIEAHLLEWRETRKGIPAGIVR